ncbi:hypothetical protein [Variovorax guangxiensis]|uniref:hypothetical protein n=1 Tax=Variovorax guangxiensis TaxID=1775474 RepID=UPI002856FAD3|nr:hypothetical protein [Variovorax guangxiensis]MDR6860009.1 hypothetical protein [Variovorax guangxiensis]
MHLLRISSTPSSSSYVDLRARLRRSLLKNPSLLNTAPQAVSDYLNCRQPCDLVAVAQWAIERDEHDLLRHLHAAGFQSPVRVSDLNQPNVLSVAAELGLAIELQLQHEINPDNVGELITFLQTPDVKITELWLDLSSEIPELPLRDLLSAVDALLGLAKLRIEVDGQSKELLPIPTRRASSVRRALANSKACMTLSAAARSLILIGPGILADFAGPIESKALRAFLDMEGCGETGKCVRSQFAHALAHLACRWHEEALLRAVRVLAPDYVMKWAKAAPQGPAIDLLARCQVPCSLELKMDLSTIEEVLRSMQRLPDVVGLTLSVENLGPDHTRNLLDEITGMRSLENFSFTIAPGVSLNLEPSLVEAIKSLLENSPKLSNILIRSQEPILLSDKEIIELRDVALRSHYFDDLRFEHISHSRDGWQGYVRINPSARPVAEKFFSLLNLPPEIGTHTFNIGALSALDVPTLVSIETKMLGAVRAAKVVADLMKGELGIQSLKLPGGEFDKDLVKEVERQLAGMPNSKYAADMLKQASIPTTNQRGTSDG